MSLSNILRTSINNLVIKQFNRSISLIPSRSSSYRSSEQFKSIENHPEVEIIQNPPEWKYVERVLGKSKIPVPLVKDEYPSGWTPPNPSLYQNLPYFVKRSRNYLVPVYLEILQNGTTRRSVVKHIEGDIWALDEEIRKLITKKTGKRSYSRINEMNRKIVFKGDYVTLIQKYLISKGL